MERIEHLFDTGQLIAGVVTQYEIPGADWVRFASGGYYDVRIGSATATLIPVRAAFTLPVPAGVPKRLFIVSTYVQGDEVMLTQYGDQASWGRATILYGTCDEEPRDFMPTAIIQTL